MKLNYKSVLSMLLILIIGISNISTINISNAQQSGLNDGYLDYTAKMAKELNDFDYGYEQLVLAGDKPGIGFITSFENSLFGKDLSNYRRKSRKYPILDFKTFDSKKCFDALLNSGTKFDSYHYIFNPDCRVSRDRGIIVPTDINAVHIQVRQELKEKYKFEGRMFHSPCMFKEYFKTYEKMRLTDLRISDPDTLDNFRYSDEEVNSCYDEGKKAIKDFKYDPALCDTSDWLLFEYQYNVSNPHCSAVDPSTVPFKINYYFTSWGLFKIGEKPDTSKPKLINIAVDANPNQAEIDKQNKEEEIRSRINPKAIPMTEEERLIEVEKFAKEQETKRKQEEEKLRLANLRAPTSKVLTKLRQIYLEYTLLVYLLILFVLMAIGIIIWKFKSLKHFFTVKLRSILQK
jgi:hypothetical protein